MVNYTDGTVIDLSAAQATWTSSDEVKVTVSGNAVSGIAAGPVTIFANYGGQMAKTELDIGALTVQKKQTYGNMILVSFLQFFMDQVYGGNTFRQSYQNIVQKLANIGSPYSMMALQLKEGQANTLALTRLGGNFAIAGLLPEIKSRTPDISITANTPQTFTANVDELTGKTRVWAVVTPPDYVAPAVVGDLEAPQVALPTFDLTDEVSGVIDGIYTGTYDDFRYNGVYRVVFYARTADGLVVDSPPTLVTVTGGQNVAVSLTVTITGTGGGTVTSYPAGIDCGTDCTETYTTATTVTLKAAPDNNADFAGWSGTGIACPGTGACTVPVDGTMSVKADFNRIILKGDLNNDGAATLADAILALKVIAGQTQVGIRADYAASGTDVDGDNKIGLQ